MEERLDAKSRYGSSATVRGPTFPPGWDTTFSYVCVREMGTHTMHVSMPTVFRSGGEVRGTCESEGDSGKLDSRACWAGVVVRARRGFSNIESVFFGFFSAR